MQYKITEEEKKNIVKIGDSECIILHRPTQKRFYEEYLKDGYLDYASPMVFITDKRIAEKYAVIYNDFNKAEKELVKEGKIKAEDIQLREAIILEAYVPMEYIFGKNWIFRREWETKSESAFPWLRLPKSYYAFWQVPNAWIRGYYIEERNYFELAKGISKEEKFVENKEFDPSFVPERRRLFWPCYGYYNENGEFVFVSDEEFDPEKLIRSYRYAFKQR